MVGGFSLILCERTNVTHATRDPRIVAALDAGAVTTDPDTGIVTQADGTIRCHFNKGYVITALGQRNGYALAHRVIWIAEHGKPDDPTLHVNHRNRIRSDNRLVNLELVTAAENSAHAAGTAFYTRIRPEDELAVDPDWLARVRALAARGNVTPAELAELRGEDLSEDDRPRVPEWIYHGGLQRLSGTRSR